MSARIYAAAGIALVLLGGTWLGVRHMRAARSGTPRAGSKNLTLQFLSAPAPMPDITMKTIDGKTISSSTWRGKVTIVNFWATWCPPCRAEIPDLIALQEKYRDQVQIIGISEDEDPPEAVRGPG